MYLTAEQVIVKCASAADMAGPDAQHSISPGTLATLAGGHAIGRGALYAGLGALFSPSGERGAGAVRGFGTGAGSVAGGIGGQLLTQILTHALTGHSASGSAQALGGLAGNVLGGIGGYKLTKKLTKTDREKQEEAAAQT